MGSQGSERRGGRGGGEYSLTSFPTLISVQVQYLKVRYLTLPKVSFDT